MEKRSEENKVICLKKIIIIGPESTGKTTLCQELALHYNTQWLPEYARTYVENLGRPYTQDDVLHIAKKQIELEEEISKSYESLFIDTDLIITKVWLQHVYGNCPDWIDEWLKKAPRSIYLVCCPDLPWEYDPVRENPELREYFLQWYCHEIESYGFKYSLVSGKGNERIESATKIVDSILTSPL
jgi:NadR type nicotinamide-nucleotide adenylyltransferase